MTDPQDRAAPLVLQIADEAGTRVLAGTLAPLLQAGDVVLLDGALAAGKTFFVRALVAALGSDDPVTSPTYTIANIYRTNTLELLHVDAYRLENGRDFYNLGLEDYLENAICLIEWGARIDGLFDRCLRIAISFEDGSAERRRIEITARGKGWEPVLSALDAGAQT